MRTTLKRLFSTDAPRRFLSVVILALMDAAAMLAGLAAAAYVTEGKTGGILYLAPVLLAVWVSVFAAYDLYNRARVRRNPGALLGAGLAWAGLLVVGGAIYPESGLTTGMVLLAVLIALLLDGALRILYEQAVELLYRQGLGRIPTVIVGDGAGRTRVRRMMEQTSSAHACVAEVDLGEGKVDLSELRAALDRTGARGVILVGGERLPEEELLGLLRSVRLRGARMRFVPGALTLMRSQPTISQSLGLPLVEVRYPRLDNTQRLMKRLLDVTVSALSLALLSPLLLAVAILVRTTSPGPVLFRQKRAGADEEVFICLMFRSMHEDAGLRQSELEILNEAEGAAFKIKEDPRVTPFGRFLRRWSLDELPQLVNVLKGDMSLVGPRPLPLRDFERMGEPHKRRLAAVPGMTGLWQISGRSNLPFEEMVRLDLFYIENWSLSFDVKIILRTLGAVLRREGAY
ncbi:MAG: exopolysaccharide biosynthesis polyprenyl glycosylphosphotransferase [Actinomycetota bacterium]|nr:exopolysaccharide biosynthesis polyprenyl glycosylphosphotransferase [Actinomycetota bacterium]